jgi:ABC-type glycerol-3-phosphate transport system permease component
MQRATIISGSNAHITGDIPAEGVKMATVIVTIGPILLVYPFVQRYFVKGLTIGSIKG